jgi:DNA modification methylase
MSLYEGDCREILKLFESEIFTSVVTDPPYGISFMNNKWDAKVPDSDYWRIIREKTKKGAFLLVFGGTRTWHHLAISIEKAGWEYRDTIMWLYGEGMPKGFNFNRSGVKKFEGYSTTLKPAWEPILLFMNPLKTSFLKNAIETGVSGLNIDDCRIPLSDNDKGWNIPQPKGGMGGEGAIYGFKHGMGRREGAYSVPHGNGRWPANCILDESVANNLGDVSRYFYCSKSRWKDKSIHPTEKPLDLMEYLCKMVKYPEFNLVLDPFMGSGTTGVACQKLNMPFIGIENNLKYFEIASNRLLDVK